MCLFPCKKKEPRLKKKSLYLQVINQLGKVFDGINIMMRRGTDKSHTSSGIPCDCNIPNNLVAWKFTSFTWLGTLYDKEANIVNKQSQPVKKIKNTSSYITSPNVRGMYQL